MFTTVAMVSVIAALAVTGCATVVENKPEPVAKPAEPVAKPPEPVPKPPEPEARPPERQAATVAMPPECRDYKAAIEALAKCDKLPEETRAALRESLAQTEAAWAEVPAEGQASLGPACKSAADAVKQSAAACN
jgi:hypothetical protein